METEVPFNHTRASIGGTLGLRAVIFDYGMVLTGPPDPEAHAALLRITGLPLTRFESLYWADRTPTTRASSPALLLAETCARRRVGAQRGKRSKS